MTTTEHPPGAGTGIDDIDAARQQVARLGRLWGMADLGERVSIEFSRRLTSSLGHCRPAQARLTIADRLREGPPELLEEVIAHEAAHAAAYLLFGDRLRPHGPEWKALMVAAGHAPRRALPVPDELRPRGRGRYRWEHRCPDCGATRYGGRPVYEWRCVACWRAGRGGVPEITRLHRPD